MKSLLTVKNLLVAILMAIISIYLFRDCTNDPEPPIIEREIDTVYQDVKVEVPKYVPKWRTKVETVEVHDSIPPKPVDTVAILADYYAKYKTVDTLMLPYPDSVKKTFGYGVVTDVISQNQIIERSIDWNYRIPTVKETITIYPKSVNQLYVGVSSALNKTNFVDNVSGGFILKTKKDRIYQASLGLGNMGGNITPFLGAGIYWKIKIKKPKVTDIIK